MVFTTFYFSGTGNTRWAVSELHKAVLEKGYHSSVYSIEQPLDNLNELINKSDIIGIAFPVYAMNMPQIMAQFLERFAQSLAGTLERKPIFVMTTAGFVNGCGPYEVIRKFFSRTVSLRGYIGLKIANNISTPMSKTDPLPLNEMEKRLNAAKKKISALVETLSADKKRIDFGIYRILIFRKLLRNILKNAYKQLNINAETCTECLSCVNNCPSKSIEMKDGALIVLPTCTACMRCYNICPTASIWHEGQFADPKVYVRYTGPMNYTL